MNIRTSIARRRSPSPSRFARAAGVAALLLLGTLAPVRSANAGIGRTSLGVEGGLPLVFGVQVARQFSPRWRGLLAGASFADLTAIQAAGQWFLLTPETRRVSPRLEAGMTQYFLQQGSNEASPVGMHVAFGLEYFLEAPISFDASVGWLRTFGSSEDHVKVFALRPDYSTALFNAGVHYHF